MADESKDASFQDVKRIGKLSAAGVFIYHLEHNRFIFLNASFVKIVEINKKLLMEEPELILQTLSSEDREYMKIRVAELLEKQVIEDVQLRLVQNTVQKFVSCNCYLTDDKSCIIGVVKDISKPRQHEDYLINFGARKNVVLDSVSQRLSTPLNFSKFTVDLLEKAVQEKKFNKLTSHINIIQEVTDECIRVIEELIREEHSASPGISTKSSRFDLISKILMVLDDIKDLNQDKKITVEYNVNHLFISCDELKFFQILQNLVSNSIKFTRQNGSIKIRITDSRNQVQIDVEDNGIGIPEELKPFIFEKHGRAGRPGLKGEVSNGVSLYLTKKLVDILGAEISFESRENVGTTFRFVLPKNNATADLTGT